MSRYPKISFPPTNLPNWRRTRTTRKNGKKRILMASSKRRRRTFAGGVSDSFRFTSKYLGDPQLLCAGGGECVDPRLGIRTFGPESLGTFRHPSSIKIGFIGTPETVEAARAWMSHVSAGIATNEGEQPF